MRLRSTLAAAACVGLLAATSAAPARAQAKDTEAAQLKKQGDDAFLGLKYADALRAYDASYEKQKNPALHFNRGRALEALERYPEALDAFEAFLRDAPPELRSKTPKLAEHVAELKAKVTTVTFAVAPAGARILVRRTAIGTAPLTAPVRLNSGPARIEVEADGHVPFTEERALAGGSAISIKVQLEKKAGSAAGGVGPAAQGAEPAPAAGSGGLFSKWWFWTGAAVVVAGAATAVVIVATQPAKPREGELGQLGAPLLRF